MTQADRAAQIAGDDSLEALNDSIESQKSTVGGAIHRLAPLS
jgi:hypothetical protein